MEHRLAVLVSGSGTLLDAIVEAGVPVALVLADRPCLALDKAENYGLQAAFLPRPSFKSDFDRDGYSLAVVKSLELMDIDVVSMAGWMTILSDCFFSNYDGRIINNHPSLLPAFKGEYAVRDALDYGVKVTGCTIHLATAELDAGPILEQEAVRVQSDDTVESLHERIKTIERPLLVRVLRQMLADEL